MNFLIKLFLSFLLFNSTLLYAQKTFTVSYDPDYEPFSYHIDKKPHGLLIDIYTQWAQANNYTLKFVNGKTWDNAVKLAKTGKVDFFLGTDPYEDWMKASTPYYKTKTSLFRLISLDVEIKTIGIIGKDYKQLLEEKFKGIKVVSYKTYDDLISGLVNSKIDAIYDDLIALSTIIFQKKLNHLVKPIPKLSITTDICAISNKSENVKTFSEGFKNIPNINLQDIESKWIINESQKYFVNNLSLELTNEEKKYLEKKKILNVCINPSWAPIEFKREENALGISFDILDILKEKLQLQYQVITTYSWKESQEFLKEKKCDILPTAVKTQKREKYANFTKPYLEYDLVIITKSDIPEVTNMSTLSSKTMSRREGSGLIAKVKNTYPDIDVLETKSTKDSFEAIIKGKSDFTISTIPVFLYHKSKYDIQGLKINGYTPLKYNLSMAVRNDDLTLLNILDKSLQTIPASTYKLVHDKWSTVKVVEKTNWMLILQITAFLVVIVIFILIYNKKLSQMVKEKTKDIEKQKNELQELSESLELKVSERTIELDNAIKEIEHVHKHTKESIRYASLIQGALIPNDKLLNRFFQDSFVYWMPKDTVGGDIWLFSKLRHKDECLLLCIDCTGHGVPGAFVTMIIKAIEREVIALINDNKKIDVSPAWIMGYFNKTMKVLLKQKNKNSISNAGFDGGIIYYNRRTQIVKFAGAETSLFYIDKNNELQTIKGNRYSVGYKKCNMNYEYQESIIHVEEGMKFYCTTDGYLDQNGGEKGFPFGKKRFKDIIVNYHTSSMDQQKEIFVDSILKYENALEENERNDDMTLIGFEIGPQSTYKEDNILEIVQYSGVITQNVIAASIDNIESKIENIGLIGTISTITIEYFQNMMHYAKNEDIGSRQIVPAGSIDVQLINNEYYKIIAKNIISIDDKNRIEPRLEEISQLDRAGIRKRYKELRKSGENTHEKGGGIGMYEIAKISNKVEYSFDAINDDKYYFTMSSIVEKKK